MLASRTVASVAGWRERRCRTCHRCAALTPQSLGRSPRASLHSLHARPLVRHECVLGPRVVHEPGHHSGGRRANRSDRPLIRTDVRRSDRRVAVGAVGLYGPSTYSATSSRCEGVPVWRCLLDHRTAGTDPPRNLRRCAVACGGVRGTWPQTVHHPPPAYTCLTPTAEWHERHNVRRLDLACVPPRLCGTM